MKKEIKVVAIVLAAILVFMLGVGLGVTKGIVIDVNVNGGVGGAVNTGAVVPDTTVAPEPETTAAPEPETTTAPSSSDPVSNETTAADPAPTDAPIASSANVPSSTADIVKKYNEVVNAAKACQDVTIHKTSNTVINVTKAPAMKDQINNIVQGLVKPSDDTYEIKGGVTADGTTATAVITPGNRDVGLDPAGVKTATATPNADGGYSMVIVLNEETSSFDGTTTVKPVHHTSCLSPLNLAELDISPAKISQAEMQYPGATLNCTVDAQGRLTHYDFKLPMSGGGTGKLVVSLDVGLEGEMVETFDLTY